MKAVFKKCLILCAVLTALFQLGVFAEDLPSAFPSPPVEDYVWDGGVRIVPPVKIVYVEGEKLDLTGFEFYETSGIRYSDGTEKITYSAKHENPDIDLANKPLTVNDKYVTATATSNILHTPISGRFEITVMPSYPISITPGYYMYHSGKDVYVCPGKPLVFRYESGEDVNAVAIVACYDKNGALVDVRTADMIVTASSDGWLWITPTEETYKVRAFAWDGIGTISPLSDVAEISRPPVQLPQGSGSAEDPYIINTLDELKSIRYTQGAECRLGRDIDMSGTVWEPFEFVGTFDGAGHKISNITVSDNAKLSGLFSLLNDWPYLVDGMPLPDGGQGSNIKNLEVEIIHSSEAAAEAGGICAAGYNANIDNCIVRGEISVKEAGDGPNYKDSGIAGGIMANQYGGAVKNCKIYADVSVTSNKGAMAGGIVGNMSSFVGFENAPRISNCESYGHITALGAEGATVYAGGIAGFGERPDAYNRFGVKDCKSYATITSSGLAGGICAVPDADWEIYGNINNSIIEN